jgi:hypothetical protein
MIDGRVLVAASAGTRLLARVWSGPGVPSSSTFELASSSREVQSISVASDGQGRHWAIWEDDDQVRLRRFDQGGALGPAIELGAGDQPAIDVAVTGEAVAVWRAGSVVRLRRLSAVGATLRTVTVVDAATVQHPDVAVRADGAAVVVWAQAATGEDVFYWRSTRNWVSRPVSVSTMKARFLSRMTSITAFAPWAPTASSQPWLAVGRYGPMKDKQAATVILQTSGASSGRKTSKSVRMAGLSSESSPATTCGR